MAVFKYKMQNILNIKYKMEDQIKNEYATANRRLLEEQEKLTYLKERRKGYEAFGRELMKQVPLDVFKIKECKDALLRMEDFITEQKEQVRLAEHKLEEKRIQLTQAMQERKTHEILRENAFEEFVQEEKATEGKQIDELTSYVYGQKRKES